jgi:hypothetical protein
MLDGLRDERIVEEDSSKYCPLALLAAGKRALEELLTS